MIKYSYLEKGVTSTSALIAYISGNVPTVFLVAIAFTDMIWIPLFIWVHLGLKPLVATPEQEHGHATG